MEIEQYIKERYNRKKRWYRICLGASLFKEKPVLNLIWLILVAIIIVLNFYKNKMLIAFDVPEFLSMFFNGCLTFTVIMIPVIIVFAILQWIGELRARKDEADIIISFRGLDISGIEPVLVRKEKTKKKDVIIREFYTMIPLLEWQKRKEAIAGNMSVSFIGDITYGGKGNRNGNRIMMKTVEGVKPKDRGILYDDTF